MKKELHLFIIWENARDKQNEILEDIKEKFTVRKVYDMMWSKENFSNNLSRFYGTNLPKGSSKEEHCGNGRFLLIVVEDENPKYEQRETSKGPRIVNINMFDSKEKYRNMTGGGHKVHATNDEVETNHDLTLLLDKNKEDFLATIEEGWDGSIEKLDKDLFGSEEWKTVKDMFYALNNCTRYAILRNYEVLPDEIYVNEHNDIDLICESKEDAGYVLNAVPVFSEEYRVHNKVKVEGKIAYFDLRYIGDNYYTKKLEERILNNRVYNEKGFYTLNKEDYFYTLIYHATIQKLDFRDDYKNRLKNMHIENFETDEDFIEGLKKWLIENEYPIERPIDKTVIFNKHIVNQMGNLLYKTEIEEEVSLLKNKNEELQHEVDELNKLVKALKNENNSNKTKLEGILDSRSWKLAKAISKIAHKG